MIAGHTHNRLDNANSKPRACYYKTDKIETLHELNYVYKSAGPKYNSTLLSPVFDFVSELDKIMKKTIIKKILIKNCHQLKISKEGVFTKKGTEEDFSTWRGRSTSEGSHIEPFQVLTSFKLFKPK